MNALVFNVWLPKGKKKKKEKEKEWGIKGMSVLLYPWKSLHRVWVCVFTMERGRTMASHFFVPL